MQLRSLKAKFIAVIALVYLVVGLTTLFAFYMGTRHIIDKMALNFATKEALLEKNKIVSIIDREVVLAQKMADDDSLKRWALDEGRAQNKVQAFNELESYRRLFRDKSFFISLAGSNHYYAYDKQAGVGHIKTVTLDRAKPSDKWFFDGLNTIDDCALNLDYDAHLRETKVWFNAIMKGEAGKKIGICGGGINITDFLNEIVFAKEKGVSTMLIDGSGVIQAHEDRAIVEHNANIYDHAQRTTIFNLMDLPHQRDQLRRAITSLADRKSDVRAFPARFDGRNYLVAVSYLRGVGWFNVVLVDVSSVISMKEFSPIIAIMFVSLLLVIVTIALMMNKMVLVPLIRLTEASHEVAAGRYDIALPLTGDDEFGTLTHTFNAMTATILDHTTNLEAKVRERTDELSESNRELAASQHKIMESIKYARIIQTSILPDRELRDRCLTGHFVLYRPKQLVGGDFYYLREFPDYFLLAAIDCTGHGVPGAFVTMTVNSVLNHVIDQVCNDDPARILSELNRVLHTTLKLREIDAGMDIALCLVSRKNGRAVYAGAGLSCYLISAGELKEVKGNLQRVGYKGSRLDFVYDNHYLDIAPGDCCYLTTDGLLDEPYGPKGYGFGNERFRAKLVKNVQRDLRAQCESFERMLDGHRDYYPQRDDITLIGFRV
jgi:phosphoserine phosphatase RsbU/P